MFFKSSQIIIVLIIWQLAACSSAIEDVNADKSDTDTRPVISVTGGKALEGNSGSVAAVFTVHLNKPSDQDVSAHYETKDKSAIAGDGDYEEVIDGVVTLLAGQSKAEITLNILGDTLEENSEDFQLILFGISSNVQTGNGLSTVSAVFVIENDDGQTGSKSYFNSTTNDYFCQFNNEW